MIIYSVTISIDQVAEIQFVEWLRNKHIQDVLDTGCFKSARLTRLTSHTQPDATNYSIQYLAESQQQLNEYYDKFAAQLRAEGQEKFGDKMQGFRTELEVLEDFFPNRS